MVSEGDWPIVHAEVKDQARIWTRVSTRQVQSANYSAALALPVILKKSQSSQIGNHVQVACYYLKLLTVWCEGIL